jgi:hypothetical protein
MVFYQSGFWWRSLLKALQSESFREILQPGVAGCQDDSM